MLSKLRRRVAAVLGLLIATSALAASPAPGAVTGQGTPHGEWNPGPQRYGIGVENDVPVRMSDGAVLKVDVSYPTDLTTGRRAAGTFPVILQQTPYQDAVIGIGVTAEYFVTRGYIYALAQVRGSFNSDGDYCFFCDREVQDGVELVDWAARRLTGSNGTLGLNGCSYKSFNQYFTAARLGKNSPVKAIAAAGGHGAYAYREPFFFGGIPSAAAHYFYAAGGLAGSASAEAWGSGMLADIHAGGDRAYHRGYWQDRAPAATVQRIVDNGIPALIWASWGDAYQSSAPELWAMFQNAYAGRDSYAPMRQNQPTTGRYQMVIGKEGHCFPNSEAELRWFDTWLKGVDTGMASTSTPLHVYELGSNRWVGETSYPLVDDYQSYYLNSGGTLTRAKPATYGGSDRIRFASPQDGALLDYTTQPFSDGATLAGPIGLTVQASSSNTNLQLIAELFDVAPDGSVERLSIGALAGSMRALDPAKTWRTKEGDVIRPFQTFTDDDYLVPSKVTLFDIQLQPRLAAIAPGHRLRLALKTQSDVEACDPTKVGVAGIAPCLVPTAKQLSTLIGGVYDIQHNGTWASQLNLPLLPYLHYPSSPAPYGQTSGDF